MEHGVDPCIEVIKLGLAGILAAAVELLSQHGRLLTKSGGVERALLLQHKIHKWFTQGQGALVRNLTVDSGVDHPHTTKASWQAENLSLLIREISPQKRR